MNNCGAVLPRHEVHEWLFFFFFFFLNFTESFERESHATVQSPKKKKEKKAINNLGLANSDS